MSTAKQPNRRSIKYIVIVVLGSLLLGMGTNLILIYTGAITGESFKTPATVASCEAECRVTYERDGREVQAVLRGTSGDHQAGEQITVTIYESDEAVAYPERVVPLGFALTVGVMGLVVTTYGGIRLFQIWRGQVEAQRTAAIESSITGTEDDKDDK